MIDDAIETVARALYERSVTTPSKPWADTLSDYRLAYREIAAAFAKRAADIGLTPADLAGLADGKSVVVPVDEIVVGLECGGEDPHYRVHFRTLAAMWRFATALAARPGAKEG